MDLKKIKTENKQAEQRSKIRMLGSLVRPPYFLNHYYKILPNLDSPHLVRFSQSSIGDLLLWSYSVHQKPPWVSPTCRSESGPLSQGPACSDCILVFQDLPLTEPDIQPEFQDSVLPLMLSILPGMLFSLRQVLDTLYYCYSEIFHVYRKVKRIM